MKHHHRGLSLFAFFCIVLLSCSSLEKEPVTTKPGVVNPQDIVLFEKAFRELGEEKYTTVIPIFKKLAEKYPGQDLEWIALYNLAGAYKGLNQCEKALALYLRLIDQPRGERSGQVQLKPRLYISLSYTYECLGKAEQALIALKESEPYINYLPENIRLIEYPARKALAYLRVNEDKTGLKIQKDLYENLSAVKNTFRVKESADEQFAGYFYTIGRSHIHEPFIQLPSFLKMFSYYQAWLTQSVLMNASKQSVKAGEELNSLYHKMWNTLKTQKDKSLYRKKIKTILQELKTITHNAKNKTLQNIFLEQSQKSKVLLKKNSTN